MTTASEVERALTRISPDCSQDVWWRVGAAVYDALGDDGFDLFDAWSARSKTKYPGRDGVWQKWGYWRRYSRRYCEHHGLEARGSISVKTLFYFANRGVDV
jgi:hypothetical protein